MKKILMSLSLLLVSICAFSQTTIDGLYRTFSDVKGAKSITIPKYMMSLVKVGTNTEKNKVLQKVDAVKLLELDNCKKSIRKKFRKAVEKLDKGDYVEFVRSGQQKKGTRLLVKGDETVITSVVVIDVSDGDCKFVKVDGHISPKDVSSVLDLNMDD
jgi:Cu/Ag efflux protein CusF